MAKAIVHLDVGAHPGGQLGSGVCVGKPVGWWGLSLGTPHPHRPLLRQTRQREEPVSGVGALAPELGGRGCTCDHKERRPHSRGDAGSPARWPGSQPWMPAAGTSRAQRGTEGGRGGAVMSAGALPAHSQPRPSHGPQPHPAPPLTWPPAPLWAFISSRNCILRRTLGSMRGGYGRPVTITPRPFMSEKSSPSLAWRAAGTFCPFVSIKPGTFPKGLPVPEPSWPHASRMSRVKNPPTLNQAGFGVYRSQDLTTTSSFPEPPLSFLPTPGPQGPPPRTKRTTASHICWTWGLREVTSLSCPWCSPRSRALSLLGHRVKVGRKGRRVGPNLLRLTFPRHTARKMAPLDSGAATLA